MTRQNNGPDRRISQDNRIRDLNLDINTHKETERLLRADVASKDVLLQEISHRVLNGFHLISGILQLQARRAAHENVRHELEIAARRVRSMALVHRRLYESAEDIMTVNAKIYLTGLCQELREGFFSEGINGNRILALDSIDDVDLSTDKMALIGLIVSELVTNACKYAYKPQEQGVVSVAFKRGEIGYRLSIGDAGAGLPDSFNTNQSKGLGMNIVKAQIMELGGTLVIEQEKPGTCFVINIPEDMRDMKTPEV